MTNWMRANQCFAKIKSIKKKKHRWQSLICKQQPQFELITIEWRKYPVHNQCRINLLEKNRIIDHKCTVNTARFRAHNRHVRCRCRALSFEFNKSRAQFSFVYFLVSLISAIDFISGCQLIVFFSSTLYAIKFSYCQQKPTVQSNRRNICVVFTRVGNELSLIDSIDHRHLRHTTHAYAGANTTTIVCTHTHTHTSTIAIVDYSFFLSCCCCCYLFACARSILERSVLFQLKLSNIWTYTIFDELANLVKRRNRWWSSSKKSSQVLELCFVSNWFHC